MRYATLLLAAALLILLSVTCGCTSAQKNGALTTPAETAALSGAAATTAEPGTPAAPVATAAKCPSGQNACADGTCRDFVTDHDACGGCGNVCPAGYVCKASACVNPAGTAAATTTATQATAVPTTWVQNPPTTTIPTTTPTQLTTYRYSGLIGGNLQAAAVETTYPPDVQHIDCTKYPIAITSISPSGGPLGGGTPIVIHGTGFKSGAYTSMNVQFGPGKFVSPTVTSGTEMVLSSPAGSAKGPVDVRVTVFFNGVSNACQSPVTTATKFTYT